MNTNGKKAVVALSGGLDSSVAALLLKQQGYEVIGLTGKMINSPSAESVIENAKLVAQSLEIEHYVYDATDSFQKKVIEYFENSYKFGKTPNPCIMCNKFIKWGELFNYAFEKLGADVYSTGHYANIIEKDGIFRLYPAADEHKDQLYFLYKLNQQQLSKTIFPLAKYSKDKVRKIAEKFNLPTKSYKESQDICFIKKPMTSKKYLIEKFGVKRGDFVDILTDKKWGEHEGCYQYTIGQRKGLGISFSEPRYVCAIDSANNTVTLGVSSEVYQRHLTADDFNWISGTAPSGSIRCKAKIRYHQAEQPATATVLPDKTVEVVFDAPQRAVTPGQAVVLYDGDIVLGGGVIRQHGNI